MRIIELDKDVFQSIEIALNPIYRFSYADYHKSNLVFNPDTDNVFIVTYKEDKREGKY